MEEEEEEINIRKSRVRLPNDIDFTSRGASLVAENRKSLSM
jgi:hypothetical protein